MNYLVSTQCVCVYVHVKGGCICYQNLLDPEGKYHIIKNGRLYGWEVVGEMGLMVREYGRKKIWKHFGFSKIRLWLWGGKQGNLLL